MGDPWGTRGYRGRGDTPEALIPQKKKKKKKKKMFEKVLKSAKIRNFFLTGIGLYLSGHASKSM